MHKDKVIETYGVESIEKFFSGEPEHRDFKFPGGVTKWEGLQAAITYLSKEVNESAIEKVAVSSHGGIVSRMVMYCENVNDMNYLISNCDCFHIEIKKNIWNLNKKL